MTCAKRLRTCLSNSAKDIKHHGLAMPRTYYWEHMPPICQGKEGPVLVGLWPHPGNYEEGVVDKLEMEANS